MSPSTPRRTARWPTRSSSTSSAPRPCPPGPGHAGRHRHGDRHGTGTGGGPGCGTPPPAPRPSRSGSRAQPRSPSSWACSAWSSRAARSLAELTDVGAAVERPRPVERRGRRHRRAPRRARSACAAAATAAEAARVVRRGRPRAVRPGTLATTDTDDELVQGHPPRIGRRPAHVVHDGAGRSCAAGRVQQPHRVVVLQARAPSARPSAGSSRRPGAPRRPPGRSPRPPRGRRPSVGDSPGSSPPPGRFHRPGAPVWPASWVSSSRSCATTTA